MSVSPLSFASLDGLIAHAARRDVPRIEPVRLAGHRYWIKRPEVLSLRWRLQKGDPARSFARERRIHHDLLARGAPVPPILAEAEGYMVLPDSGPTLEALMRGAAPCGERLRAFEAAGAALAGMHGAGLVHGRPLPRDLCWNGERITFLDFEGGARAGRASMGRKALDLVLALHGIYALSPRPVPEADAFCNGYRGADDGLWRDARRRVRRWRWIDTLTRPLQYYEARFKPHRTYKELLALPWTFAQFTREDGG